MGQDPREIRQDIEQTRERMGDTVEALGHKTDVTGRAKEAMAKALLEWETLDADQIGEFVSWTADSRSALKRIAEK